MLLHLLLGGIAGWLAGQAMRGNGYGVIIDIILGLLGGWIGGYIGQKMGVHLGGKIGYLVTAFFGAVLLVWISRLIRRRV
ncbi:GlsB/YeaQ/YmgE family stress response membrane protein [Puia dinghuensis]|uniref:GlsB/YeaQ/YmgE family stress response membrane protein n=1 Tax=Puia dinghuensis TaxID=1792502 RepID=UPI001662E222|nr:GlsB/YeaQ/YmgE family stress response membrane protein [Puia dinghuensis]